MQSYVLTVENFFDHAATWVRDRRIVTAIPGGTRPRTGHAKRRARSKLGPGALVGLDPVQGDRASSLAWKTGHRLEMMYAAAVGFVWHKLNPRPTTLHLADMIDEADDKVLTLAANMLPLLEEVARLCQCLKRISVPDAERDATYKRALATRRSAKSQSLAGAGRNGGSARL